MTYDLRHEAWLPFRRAGGEIVWGSPSLLTDQIETNPIVTLAAPRPDFNGALLEFLIGLFTAALQPEDEEAWRALWHTPPKPEVLQSALDALPNAFYLDGEGPRFLQDFDAREFSDGEPNDIEALLIDAAGSQTARLNKDLFVKRNRVAKLSRASAAMALIALQSYAPSGGQGHRTSMRGGGPLTTLIEPRVRADGGSLAHRQPLWRKIWANAETVEQWEKRGPDTASAEAELVYPWLTRTRTSNPKLQGRPTTPQEAHPLQAWFGMPRRIRLVFENRQDICDLTGKNDNAMAIGFRARNYGVEYDSWLHPLSPYYLDKKSGWLPIHGQSDGVGWRDWAVHLYGTPDDGKRPAQSIAQFRDRRAGRIGVCRPRLHAFGYDMDNMKARGWVETELPAFALEDAEQSSAVSRVAAQLTQAADIAASALLYAVKDAKGDPSSVKSRFWAETEKAFFQALERILVPDAPADIETRIQQNFREPLVQAALSLFDALCPMEGLEFADARRLVAARHGLGSMFRGYGKLGVKFFTALTLALPDRTKISRKRKEDAA